MRLQWQGKRNRSLPVEQFVSRIGARQPCGGVCKIGANPVELVALVQNHIETQKLESAQSTPCHWVQFRLSLNLEI
jgi:hypothetical protein